jgi:hypothetical protein
MIKRASLVAVLALVTSSLVLAHGNARAEVKAEIGGKTVTIEYGRPSLKGRDMLGQAEAGMTWRLGADGATTLRNEGPLGFGEQTVPPGEYVLKARKVADGGWHLVVTAGDEVVAEVPLTTSELAESVEMFTIELSGSGRFEAKWGTLSLATDLVAR